MYKKGEGCSKKFEKILLAASGASRHHKPRFSWLGKRKLKHYYTNRITFSSDPKRTACHVEHVDELTKAGRPFFPQRKHKENRPEAIRYKVCNIYIHHQPLYIKPARDS